MNTLLHPARLALAALAAAAPAPGQSPTPDPLLGSWQGTLSVANTELEVAMHITVEGDGYAATFDSITQGAEGIPVTTLTVDGTHLVAELRSIGGRYEAELEQDGDDRQLVGQWSQGGATFDLDLVAVAEVVKPVRNRPQTPQPPFPYRVEEVVFSHRPAESLDDGFAPRASDAEDAINLAGTLTLPEGEGPFPAAVMITGSGRQDRDETVFEHKPFWVIADHLTREGLAVLRCDDRGAGQSTGDFAAANSADFATDARAAVRWLRTRTDIDPQRIGLIGHSEGGVIAPMVAAGDDKDWIHFSVLLAPPAVNIADVIRHQSALIAKAEGADSADVEANDRLLAAVFGALTDPDAAEARDAVIDRAINEAWDTLSEAAKAEVGGNRGQLQQQIARMDRPWMRYLLQYDPLPALREMRGHVLAVLGGKDLQVDPEQNLEPLRSALLTRDAGDHDTTIRVLDNHNHLLQRCETGSPTEYIDIEETVSPEALALLADWLRRHVLQP